MSEHGELDPEDLEEIRIAVVMNGGVSLAVWIGGVANELNDLVRSRASRGGTVYEGLLDIVQGVARVDVISGTSAGGINGAFLALASVYDRPLSELGELWARSASMRALLREPQHRDPPSFFRGDDHFLTELNEAFQGVFPDDYTTAYRPPDEVPIDLTMTTSLMEEHPLPFVDNFGTTITEATHRARFHFSRTERTAKEDDPFASPDIVPQLALAARSTASFPAAFEPSFIPVGHAGPDDLHPDMKRFFKALTADDLAAADLQSSQFVLDGGILLNQPILPAIRAIASRSATRQVRRILAHVNPDPRPPNGCGSGAEPKVCSSPARGGHR